MSFKVTDIKHIDDFKHGLRITKDFGNVTVMRLDVLTFYTKPLLVYLMNNLRRADRVELKAFRHLLVKMGVAIDTNKSFQEYLDEWVDNLILLSKREHLYLALNKNSVPFAIFGAEGTQIMMLGTDELDNPVYKRKICMLSKKFVECYLRDTSFTYLSNFVFKENDKAVALIDWLGFDYSDNEIDDKFITVIKRRS